MKKIILSLVFVFTMGTMVNAKTTESINKHNIVNYVDDEGCYNTADMATRINDQRYYCENGVHMTYEQSHAVWLIAFDLCTGNQHQ